MKKIRYALIFHVIPVTLMICILAYAMVLVNQQLS